MPRPCICSEPGFCPQHANAPSLRGGKKVGRDYELCAGINCTKEQSERYRSNWDAESQRSSLAGRTDNGETIHATLLVVCALGTPPVEETCVAALTRTKIGDCDPG